MGFSEQEKSCKDHPYHNQKQGVCPSCLREKLSQIYVVAIPPSMAAISGSSSMSTSSVSSSAKMSPLHHRHHQRTASDLMASIPLKINSYNGLKKNKSVALVSRNVVEDVKHGKNKRKKGFWSKLLHLKGSNKEFNFNGKIALNSHS